MRGRNDDHEIGDFVIAGQRVRLEVAGPMTSSAKQSIFQLRSSGYGRERPIAGKLRARESWIASSLSLLAMTS
jgi:hypothetical protein